MSPCWYSPWLVAPSRCTGVLAWTLLTAGPQVMWLLGCRWCTRLLVLTPRVWELILEALIPPAAGSGA